MTYSDLIRKMEDCYVSGDSITKEMLDSLQNRQRTQRLQLDCMGRMTTGGCITIQCRVCDINEVSKALRSIGDFLHMTLTDYSWEEFRERIAPLCCKQ